MQGIFPSSPFQQEKNQKRSQAKKNRLPFKLGQPVIQHQENNNGSLFLTLSGMSVKHEQHMPLGA